MARNVLLIEPNYKNKYPPMGLMKISTYYKNLGDNVTFFKGNLHNLVLEDLYESILPYLYKHESSVVWEIHRASIIEFLKTGKETLLHNICNNNTSIKQILEYYRDYYKKKKYLTDNKKWDIICITTLFTFHWKITIDTINFAKQLCKDISNVKVGGIMATLLPNEVKEATGISPICGVLDKPGMLGDNNEIIIDNLPLDYSIIYESEYIYPAKDAFYGYVTRGCINNCSFCAVPKLEPHYQEYKSISGILKESSRMYGEQRNLLLLDNNILASDSFNKIIDEIKDYGFNKNSKYIEPNFYKIAIDNLSKSLNDKAYINIIVDLYKSLFEKYRHLNEVQELYNDFRENYLFDRYTAKKEIILKYDDKISKIFDKYFAEKKPKERFVDFNQGIDARLINEDNMKKLAEIPIKPVRIAFDHWSMRGIYEKAVRTAVKAGHKNLSNYILYNYQDKPEELYNRLKLNVDLCDELNASIYSFPMKYHPIQDEKYFKNRDYTGKYWNRKFIRTIQAILNSTKGKVGKGSSFFYKAFGKNIDEFNKLLYMPEALIIYRLHFENNGITERWWSKYSSLNNEEIKIINNIIEQNSFSDITKFEVNDSIKEVLQFYTIKRTDALIMDVQL